MLRISLNYVLLISFTSTAILLSGCARQIPTPEELSEAVGEHDWILVEKMIRNGVDVTAYERGSRETMREAILFRKHNIMELLLSKGYDPNEQDSEGMTAIFQCKRDIDTQVADLLISCGADLNQRNKQGITPLIWLLTEAKGSKTQLMDMYIFNGAEVNAADSSGMTPLHYAVSNDREEFVEFLLTRKADVNAMSDNGTPLHIAASEGYARQVKFLLEQGAKVNRGLRNGRSPLDAAKSNNHKKVIEILEFHGAGL